MKAQLGLLLTLFIACNVCSSHETDYENDSVIPHRNHTSKWMANPVVQEQFRNFLKVFKPMEDINFYLYTRMNPMFPKELFIDDVKSVEDSAFDPRDPTRIIIHGWMSGADLDVNTLIRDAYLSTGPHNIIAVNWRMLASGLYPNAAGNVPLVGKELGTFIDFMASYDYLKPENLTIIGHSLGAHIAGVAARGLKCGQIHTIVGLDPASLLFSYETSDLRLRTTDAYYVESIQTDGAHVGYKKPIGKATFYPNGGQVQPGCGLDAFGGCSHYRSYRYFAEAVRINGFPSVECRDYNQAIAKACGNMISKTVRMGALGNADLASGAYYVPTNSMPPYAVESNKI